MNIRSAFEAVPTPAAVLGCNLVLQSCNKAYAHLAQTEEARLVGRPLFEIFPGKNRQQRELLAASFDRVIASGEPDLLVALPYSVCDAEEGGFAVRFWSVSNIPLFDEAGTMQAILHCPTELTWRRSRDDAGSITAVDGSLCPQEIQHALNTERERFRQLFQQAPGFICVLHGPEHVYELANDAYERLVGQREIIGRPLSHVLPEVVAQGVLTKLDRVYATGEPYIGRAVSVQLQRSAGGELEERFIDLIFQPMIDRHGKISGIFVQGNDVTEAAELAREVSHQAQHDPLTSLFNRRGFSRRTNGIKGPGPNALLYMDIDHFKIVNDRCSHAAGDSLLLHVAQRLKEECSVDDVLARLGGDEFALLRPNCGLEEALQLAGRLREAVKEINFVWLGRSYRVTLSWGL
ncbi:MAG: diguanylate cyclase [Pseudorhizobium sp.]